jgi:hypothetical protein
MLESPEPNSDGEGIVAVGRDPLLETDMGGCDVERLV